MNGNKEIQKPKQQVDKRESGTKQILEYPDYEANKEDDFYEGHTSASLGAYEAGNQATPSTSQRRDRQETARREHDVSSEEEDDIEMLEDPHDNINDDFLGDEEAWDRHSIASSAIFPDQKRMRERETSVGRPELERSRSRQQLPRNDNRGFGAGNTNPRVEQSSNSIEELVKERVGVEQGKDTVGPPIADCIADLLQTYLREPSSEAMLKLLEDYPRPANANWLQAPTVGTQVAASILKRSNNYDKRLRQSQLFVGGSLAAMANVLQDIMNRGKEDSSLLGLAKKVMDAMALSGYVHFDFNEIRKGAIRQVVNPSYAGVFTRRTSATPENLLGESSVPDQLKEYEEINRVRAKLQKPRKFNSGEGRQDNARGRGRGFNPNNNNRGGFSNRNHGSGFGNHQRGGRGSRPGYPQQRRVYGQNYQNYQNQQPNKDQKNN